MKHGHPIYMHLLQRDCRASLAMTDRIFSQEFRPQEVQLFFCSTDCLNDDSAVGNCCALPFFVNY